MEGTYQLPQGPPPSRVTNPSQEAPPSYEEWMSVRENPSSSGLPPPPTIHHEDSSIHNATGDEEHRAHDWCNHYPLFAPGQYNTDVCTDICQGKSLIVPVDSSMTRGRVWIDRNGTTQIVRSRAFAYQCLRSQWPLYSALGSLASSTGKFTAYFEIKVVQLDKKNDVAAIGFFAPPYPPFRLPGWQRASIGIHSDDGRRYVNDTFGGMSFTKPFRTGEVIGLGMIFEPTKGKKSKEGEHVSGSGSANVQCFMTRNGQRQSDWEWDLHEEIDSKVERPGGVTGLEGDRDIFAAVGVYGTAIVEVRFGKNNCMWWPH